VAPLRDVPVLLGDHRQRRPGVQRDRHQPALLAGAAGRCSGEESVMSNELPRDRVDRLEMRQAVMDAVAARAGWEAVSLRLSINCQDDVKAGIAPSKHRCGNDGSACLCECHDAAEAGR
jgi:hypothetical protein